MFKNTFQYCGPDKFDNHLFIKKDNLPKLERYLKNKAALKDYKMPHFKNLEGTTFYKLKFTDCLKNYRLVKSKYYKISHRARTWHMRQEERCGICLDVVEIRAEMHHQSTTDTEDNLKKPVPRLVRVVDPIDEGFLFVDGL